MSFTLPPWDSGQEPSQTNVRSWMDNLYAKFQPMEQARWNQANIDSQFYAGSQQFINRHYNFTPSGNGQNFHFNIMQQPVNMITGYQRQHRKSLNYIPSEAGDPHTTDQYTRLMVQQCNAQGINEEYSRACELSCVSGMVLMQPYLDYHTSDPLQGELRLKTWEYNSFLIDPWFRQPDLSDCNFVWCQEYISKKEAEFRMPDMAKDIAMMSGAPQRYGNFYFLPEHHNMARNDLLTISYVWYRWKRKKNKLYSRSLDMCFDYSEKHADLEAILYQIPDMEVVKMDVPSWKVAVILNDKLVFQDFNPLGFDTCPFIPVFWNYDPHVRESDLRVRSLVRTMRDAQFLLNRRILINHDISESSINSGWKRKQGAVANEENLKRSGQGWDLVINDGYEMSDVEKIIPNAVPASDMQLAEQLQNMIFAVSGVNLENWSAQDDPRASSLTVLLKQGANLMVLQKYFDQWDFAFKLLGDRLLQIVLNNWKPSKVKLIIGEDPSPHFYSHIFSKYQVLVEEGLSTAIQRQQEFQQWMELNASLGGIIPPHEIAKRATIQGKTELVQLLESIQQQKQAMEQEAHSITQTLEEAKLKELYSRAAANIAMARERHGRSESNIGLFEERISAIQKNQALATKDKVEALSKLVETLATYGEPQVAQAKLAGMELQTDVEADEDRTNAQRESLANNFYDTIMQPSGQNPSAQQQEPDQNMPQQPQEAENGASTSGP